MPVRQKCPWPDFLKGVAMIGVCFEHWTDNIPHQSSLTAIEKLTTFTNYGAVFIHQFFLLSGFGLTFAYLNYGIPSWRRWARQRFAKVVVPYWTILALTLLLLTLLTTATVTPAISLAYFTFTRNFFPEAWDLNSSFWFMPVIIGLYLSFPLLARLLDRRGPAVLGVVAIVVTLGTSAVLALAGYPVIHQAAFFPSYLAPFAAGMILAWLLIQKSVPISVFVGWRPVLLGTLLISLSALLVTSMEFGFVANDTLTALGTFLILINLYYLLPTLRLEGLSRFLSLFGRHSFTVYLIHLPIIQFAVAPLLLRSDNYVSSPLLLAVQLLSIPALLLLALILHPPLTTLSDLARSKKATL